MAVGSINIILGLLNPNVVYEASNGRIATLLHGKTFAKVVNYSLAILDCNHSSCVAWK